MKIFLIAGEPSGDMLGGALLAGLKSLCPDVQISGVGGPQMIAQGLDSQFPMEELSVMGIAEILPKYFHLKQRIRETADAILAAKPDAVVSIDSPDFCLRVAKLVKQDAPDQKIIHYVAPSVWAWRPGRAAKMAKCVDHVLALLPFEPPYMEAVGLGCDFVGHPVVAEPRADKAAADAFRETHMIAPDQPLVLCLPGSRKSEVSRLGARFDEALMQLRDREPGLRVVVPTVKGVSKMVGEMTARWPIAPIVVQDPAEKRAAFAAADLALAASGTVSLELAASRTPMVIAYDASMITWNIIWRMMKIDTVTLVNLVSDTRVIPEFLGPECRPEKIARMMSRLLEDSALRAGQLVAMDRTMERLGEGGEAPGMRAARAVLDVVNGGKTVSA
ncbi:lipid-A-disaccharide synthase [Thioclava sp. SK-1]|uniref:lipid-A-disaccharide synthase n=1 Tax=Thioclava sp. SK-1 TaxID=1889770 RepID=UPI0008257C3E|nr:lipid-A-disaccharide synthase [Thioclava sp. SK-1]OCX67088.1 lipid-A-disaccharide synthase [Thioclava sp. SK-1]